MQNSPHSCFQGRVKFLLHFRPNCILANSCINLFCDVIPSSQTDNIKPGTRTSPSFLLPSLPPLPSTTLFLTFFFLPLSSHPLQPLLTLCTVLTLHLSFSLSHLLPLLPFLSRSVCITLSPLYLSSLLLFLHQRACLWDVTTVQPRV